jgi:hypothetical protein
MEGYGNGVYETATCAETHCTDEDRLGCCKTCTQGWVWDGKCRQRCPTQTICFGEWVDAPTGGEYEDDLREKFEALNKFDSLNISKDISSEDFWKLLSNLDDYSEDYWEFLSNFEYSGYCQNTTCTSEDVNTCCIPSKRCEEQNENALCKGEQYTGGLLNKRCDNYICTADECCTKTQCNCTNGNGTTGKECPISGEFICATCDVGYWRSNGKCLPIKDCDQDTQYQGKEATETTDKICYYKSICQDSQYISTPATNTSDRGCSILTICNSSEYISSHSELLYEKHGEQNFTMRKTNVVCSPLQTCSETQYEDTAPIFNKQQYQSARICKNISEECDYPTQFEAKAPTKTADRQCNVTKQCDYSTQFEAKAPTKTADRQCQTIAQQCNYSTHFEDAAPTNISDRKCEPIGQCDYSTQFEAAAPSNTTNRVCNNSRLCTEMEYEIQAPTLTSDRQCSTATICNASLLQYEVVEKTTTSDRQCKTCLNNQTKCVGCTTTSDCEFNQESKVLNESECSKKTCTRYIVSESNVSQLLRYGEWFRFDPISQTVPLDLEFMAPETEISKSTNTTIVNITTVITTIITVTQSQRINLTASTTTITTNTTTITDANNSKDVNTVIESVVSTQPSTIVQKDNYKYFYIDEDFPGDIYINNNVLNIQQDCTFENRSIGACSNPCGVGTRILTRGAMIKPAKHGGKACDKTPELITESCNETRYCPIDCVFTWDTVEGTNLPKFGKCNSECGKQGIQYRNYTIHTPAQYKGKACPAFEKRGCEGEPEEGFCDCRKRKMDQCGICGGDDSTCKGCDGVIELDENKRKVFNECGKCVVKGTPCALKFSKTKLKRKQFRSNLLKTLLPAGTMVILVSALSTLFYYSFRYQKTRKQREIYLT